MMKLHGTVGIVHLVFLVSEEDLIAVIKEFKAKKSININILKY